MKPKPFSALNHFTRCPVPRVLPRFVRTDDPPDVGAGFLALPPVRTRAWNSNRAEPYSTEAARTAAPRMAHARSRGISLPRMTGHAHRTPSADEPRGPHRLQRGLHAVGEADDRL